MILTNNGEGGSNGSAITTGNSGGASGNAWDSILAAAGTCAYDNTQTAHGALSLTHSTSGTAASLQLQWEASTGNPARMWGRYYYRYTSTTLTLDLHRVRNSSGSQVGRLTVASSTGFLQLRNGGNTVVATSSTALSTGTWYRIEWDFQPGSVTNTAWIYAADSVVPLETVSASSSYGSTDCGQFHLGNLSSQANVGQRWFDDVAVTDLGWLGPASARRLSALGCG